MLKRWLNKRVDIVKSNMSTERKAIKYKAIDKSIMKYKAELFELINNSNLLPYKVKNKDIKIVRDHVLINDVYRVNLTDIKELLEDLQCA